MSEIKEKGFVGPYWGKSYNAIKGRDPLGMQKGSIATYGVLVPGLTNITNRIRYYGYYCWLIQFFEINILEKEKDQTGAFKKFIRRSEYLMAIIMTLYDSKKTGVPGSDYAAKFINKNPNITSDDFIIDISEGADKIDSNDRRSYFLNSQGAFGQYYVGQMKYLGLIGTNDASKSVYWVTDYGKEFARAFHENLVEEIDDELIKALFLKVFNEGKIKTSELKRIKDTINISLIPEFSAEYTLYSDMLLGLDSTNETNFPYRTFRKETILRVLRTFDIEDQSAFPFDFYEQNYLLFDDLSETDKGWLLYQISEISNFSHVTLLWGLLMELSENNHIQLDDMISYLTSNIILEMEEIDSNIFQSSKLTSEIINTISENNLSPNDYISICYDQVKSPGNNPFPAMANAVISILSLYSRHSIEFDKYSKYSESFGIQNEDDVISTLKLINKYLNLTLRELIQKILKENVITRHIHVALKKLRLRAESTLKFKYDGNELSVLDIIEPEWSTPRLNTLKQFLLDLNFLQKEGDTTILTDTAIELIGFEE